MIRLDVHQRELDALAVRVLDGQAVLDTFDDGERRQVPRSVWTAFVERERTHRSIHQVDRQHRFVGHLLALVAVVVWRQVVRLRQGIRPSN